MSYEGDWTMLDFLLVAEATDFVNGTDDGFLVGIEVREGQYVGLADGFEVEGFAVGAILGFREGV